MAVNTLWESIVKLAGENGEADFDIQEAISRSAVSDQVAQVEVRRFVADGLLTETGNGRFSLTGRGAKIGEDLFPGSSIEDLKADEGANDAPNV